MRPSFYALCASVVVLAVSVAHAGEAIPSARLSLDDSIRQALAYSPVLKAKAENIGGSRGESLQSGLIPNPDVSFGSENVLGTGSARGVSGAQLTLGVSQTVQTGGKRGARMGAASRKIDIARLEYVAAGLDLIRDTTAAWVEAVSADEEWRLAQEQKNLADDMLQSVSHRVAAAAENAIQQSKAEAALALARAGLAKAERNKTAALKSLAGLWGGDAVPALDAAAFFSIQPPEAAVAVDGNPDLKLTEEGVVLARANLDVERANAVPDVTFQAGVRESRDVNERSFLAGVSVPFPVFDRNQGAILKARHDVARAEQEKAAAVNTVKIDLLRSSNALDASYVTANSYEKDILPSAEKAFAQARKTYQAGRFPYLEVLDAQRTLFDVRAQRIAALKDYHVARAVRDRLTGKYLALIPMDGEQK